MLNQNEASLIERERERIFLQGALDALRSGNPNAPQAIFITGAEGTGRSSLLAFLARQARHSIQLRSLAFRWPPSGGRSGVSVLNYLLGKDEFSPLYPYLENFREYLERAKALETRIEQIQLSLGLPDLKKMAWGETPDPARFRTVQALPPAALHFILRRLYTLYTPNQLSEQAAAFFKTGLEHIIQLNATNLGQLRAFVDEELRPRFNDQEWDFYLKPEETLARTLAEAINAYVLRDRPLLLCFDDYHPGENDRLLKLVIEETKNVLWVFTANQRPNWAERIERTAELPLENLTESGVKAYFEAKYGRSLNADETSWLQRLTEGLPLAVAIAADLYANGATPTDLDAAIERAQGDKSGGLFLYFVEESGRLSEEARQRLYALAIMRHPSQEFLAKYEEAVKAAGYPYDPTLTEQLLKDYSWLAEQTESVDEAELPNLQPVLGERLRRYLMLERRRFSQPIQEGIVEPARNVAVANLNAIEEELVAEPEELGSLKARANHPEWGEAVADMVYYRLWLDEAVGWVLFLPRWVMALAYNRSLAYRLLTVVESMEQTFYTEGADLLPLVRLLMRDSYTLGRKGLDDKLAALQKIEKIGTDGRNRWFKSENLGKLPASKGSAEAELRGIVQWLQAQVYEEAGQYEKAAPLYEGVLATNVEMPELKLAASHSALYLALRYRLKNAAESAYSALYRAAELDDQQQEGIRALFWQSISLERYDTALKAADTLLDLKDEQAELFMIFALYALDRKPEALTEARALAARLRSSPTSVREELRALLRFANLPDDGPELLPILNELN